MKIVKVIIFLSVILCLTLVSAGAYESRSENYIYTYEYYGDGVILTGYEGNGNSVAIPSTIESRPVTYLSEKLFYGHSEIRYVSFEGEPNVIGNEAFSGCSSLLYIKLPDSVVSVGERAFAGCSGLVYADIGEGVVQLGSEAFSGCSSLENINLPHSVEKIGDRAFADCISLRMAAVPSSRVQFGKDVFPTGKDFCVCLPKDTKIDGVKDENIGYCPSLSELVFSVSGSAATLIKVPEGATALVIPKEYNGYKVTAMSSDATKSCGDTLRSVCLPDTFINLSVDHFSGLSGLEYVRLPENGQEVIRDDLFKGLSELRYVFIANGTKQIGNDAFSGCQSLGYVYLPRSITKIGNGAFYACENLSALYITGDVPVCTGDDISVGVVSFGGVCPDMKVYIDGKNEQKYIHDGLFCPNGHNKYKGYKIVDATHDCFDAVREVVSANCENKGKIEIYCPFCNRAVATAEEDAKGHDFVTVNRNGIYETRRCTRCSVDIMLTHIEDEGIAEPVVDISKTGVGMVKRVNLSLQGIMLERDTDFTFSAEYLPEKNIIEVTVHGINSYTGDLVFGMSSVTGRKVGRYYLTVNGTDGSGYYYYGETVKIFADKEKAEGHTVKWSSDYALFEIENDEFATFYMSPKNMTVNVEYVPVEETTDVPPETSGDTTAPVTTPPAETSKVPETTQREHDDFGDTAEGKKKKSAIITWAIVLGCTVILGGGAYAFSVIYEKRKDLP